MALPSFMKHIRLLEKSGWVSTRKVGRVFGPHITGCFLAVDDRERIVFTNSLVAGWRPAETPFMTAVITFADHPDGTQYVAHVMHRSAADRDLHEEMGFYEGWGTVVGQLAAFVEKP